MTLHMTRTASLETAQRERSQAYKERQYVDKDDIIVKSQNKDKASVDPMRSITSYARMCREVQE